MSKSSNKHELNGHTSVAFYRSITYSPDSELSKGITW